jgi:hypothetical protein
MEVQARIFLSHVSDIRENYIRHFASPIFTNLEISSINTKFYYYIFLQKIWGCEQEELRSSEQRENGGDIQGKSQHRFYHTFCSCKLFMWMFENPDPHPHQIKIRSAASNKNQDPDLHQFADDKPKCYGI